MASSRAIVVDDAADVRLLLELVLTMAGCDVAQAESGQEALRLLAEGNVPDIMVMDVHMPGLDGWETLSAVRGDPRTAHVPVAFCSSGMEPQDVRRAWDLGADGVFAKPIDIGRVVREVREILARPGPDSYGRSTSPQ